LHGRGVTRGDSVSSQLRFGVSAFFLIAGFTTPAASNALTDLFSPPAAPEAAAPAAPAPAQDSCASRPGPAAAGGHWVYRYDGHRKCWFQAEESGAVSNKPAHHRVARRSAAASEQDKPAPRSRENVRENVEDARAEMPNAAPEQTPQPAPPEPKLTIVRTIPVREADAAGQIPPAPVLNKPDADQSNSDQIKPDQPTSDPSAPRQLDVETLLAKAPPASAETAYYVAPSIPIADPGATTRGIEAWIPSWLGTLRGGEAWMPSWLGALLIALGGVALLGAGLRRILWPARSPDTRTERWDFAHDGRYDPSFGRRIAPAGASRDELLHYDPQSVSPLAHAARTRRPEAPEPPPREALWDEGMDALAALGGTVSPQVFGGRRGAGYRGVE
jgi:hypothetical protein